MFKKLICILFAIIVCQGITVKADTYGVIYSFVERVLTVSGTEYEVTVRYDKMSGVPVGSELRVREVEKGSEEYQRYLEKAQESLEGRIVDAGFLDIEIVKDGKKIEPKTPVMVEIRKVNSGSSLPSTDVDEDETASVAAEEPLLAEMSLAGEEEFFEAVDVEDLLEAVEEDTAEENPVDTAGAAETVEEDSVDIVATVEEDSVETVTTAEGANLNILHFQAEDSSELIENVVSNEEMMVFQAESFSIYGIIYTVDFSYEVDGRTYEFSIPGGGFISFTELVRMLGVVVDDINTETDEIQEFVDDVESLVFSSPQLLDVSKVEETTTVGEIKERRGLDCQYSAELTGEKISEINRSIVSAGDWVLISLLPFTSEESLTVTMKDGEAFVIRVTDEQTGSGELRDGDNGSRPTLAPLEAEKTLRPNKIEGTDQEDGTYKLSLSVKGDEEYWNQVTKANVLIVMDRSSSMKNGVNGPAVKFKGTPNQGTTYYGLVDGTLRVLSFANNGGNIVWTYEDSNNNTYSYTDTENIYITGNRLQAEQEALDDLVKTLLSKNVTDTNSPEYEQKKDIIEISVISFADQRQSGNSEQDWSTSYDAVMDAINQTNTPSGTNWEDALKYALDTANTMKDANHQPDEDVYIIFLTDGEPTAIYGEYARGGHTGAHHYNNSSNGAKIFDGYIGDNYYGGNNATYNELYGGFEYAYDFAKDDAEAIVNSGHKFYGIFTPVSVNPKLRIYTKPLLLLASAPEKGDILFHLLGDEQRSDFQPFPRYFRTVNRTLMSI